jgi:hypothetical protein
MHVVQANHLGPAPLAIIEAFYPGPRGAEALANGIFGRHNAWGRLPYTIYPKSFADEAEMSMHDLREPPGRTYRYYEKPLFSFGHGLSLSTWRLSGTAPGCLSGLATDGSDGPCAVVLTLQNSGKHDGDAVVMGYFKSHTAAENTTASGTGTDADRTLGARADTGTGTGTGKKTLLPMIKQLFDFQRVTVGSGGSVTLTFNLTAAVLSEYGATTGDRVAKAGGVTLMFEDGGGQVVTLVAKVTGPPMVVEPFPSTKPTMLPAQ